jgi:biotin carboxylase
MNEQAQPTVLLCDAAFSAVPILLALKRRGFRVVVCGSRPADPGHALADQSLMLDYSDREALLDAVQTANVEFLVPGCTDVSYLSCAWVAAQLGLPGYDALATVNTINRKDAFRAVCRAHRFPTPRSTASQSEASALRFPMMIKPSDSFSGKGIVKIHDATEFESGLALARAQSASQSVVFEEFVEGSLHSHSAFLRGGKIASDFFVDEYCTVHPYQVNSSNVSMDLDGEVVDGLRKWLGAFADALKLGDGLVHTQFIVAAGKFYLIEVTRRCPGDLYALLIERSTGIDYASLFAASFCGIPIADDKTSCARRYVSRHTVSVDRDCIYFASRIALHHQRVSFAPLKKTGERLRAAPLDRAGIYFIDHRSAAEMTALTPRLRSYVTVETLEHV